MLGAYSVFGRSPLASPRTRSLLRLGLVGGCGLQFCLELLEPLAFGVLPQAMLTFWRSEAGVLPVAPVFASLRAPMAMLRTRCALDDSPLAKVSGRFSNAALGLTRCAVPD